MLHTVSSLAEKEENLDIGQEIEEDLALFVMPTLRYPRILQAVRQVVLKAMFETIVLVSTKAQT